MRFFPLFFFEHVRTLSTVDEGPKLVILVFKRNRVKNNPVILVFCLVQSCSAAPLPLYTERNTRKKKGLIDFVV